MMIRAIKTKRRFTLLEMLAATAILSLVGLIIGTSLATFNRTLATGERAAARLKKFQNVDLAVERTLHRIIPFIWTDDEGSNRYFFTGTEEEVYAVALDPKPSGQGAFTFFRLYFDDGKLLIDHSKFPLYPWYELTDQSYATETIADNVTAIRFLYLANDDENGGVQLLETWDEEEQTGMPLAIQLTIDFADGSKERWLRRLPGVSSNSELLNESSDP